MNTNFSKGRYNVYSSTGAFVGRIDCDEFVRNGIELVYRIDNDEVYMINGVLMGFIDGRTARKPDGSVLFEIRSE